MRVKNVLRTVAVAAGVLVGSAAMAQPCGMGSGMADCYGGYGGYGMGPGMMGGYGAPGMGPGMMRGYCAPGMGPGMMWGWGDEDVARGGRGLGPGLGLTAEQRKKIASIEEETAKGMWQLMGTMHQQGYHMPGMFGAGPVDEQAARKSYQAMAEAQKSMFELRLEARRKIEAVLTKEQREVLRQRWGDR